MKLRKICMFSLMAVAILPALSGCAAKRTAEPVNEVSFSLDGIKELTISYDEEEIIFLESESDAFILREYMTENKSRYYARIQQGRDNIRISEGGKPLFHSGFSRYVEVYLPASYREGLTVTSTNGTIDLSKVDLKLSSLRIDCTSGSVLLKEAEASEIFLSSTSGVLEIGELQGETIKLETTSGSIICEKLDGNVIYTSTSGELEVKAAIGSGSYKANNSGRLDVTYEKVDGSLLLYNKNDDIYLTLPKDLEFTFCGTTKNGSITTSFPEAVTPEGGEVKGTIGQNPTAEVEVETKNGKIEVIQ